jgi:hypothetical protein
MPPGKQTKKAGKIRYFISSAYRETSVQKWREGMKLTGRRKFTVNDFEILEKKWNFVFFALSL